VVRIDRPCLGSEMRVRELDIAIGYRRSTVGIGLGIGCLGFAHVVVVGEYKAEACEWVVGCTARCVDPSQRLGSCCWALQLMKLGSRT